MNSNKLEVIVAIEEAGLLRKVESIFGSFENISKVTTVKEYQDLKNYLDKKSQDTFFVIDLDLDKYKAVKSKAQEHVINNSRNVIYLSENAEDEKSFEQIKEHIIGRNIKLIEFSSLVSDLLQTKTTDYIPISINSYYKVKSFPCDTYVKLGLDKYIKIVQGEDIVETGFLDKYKKRNVSLLYVSEKDFYNKCTDLFADKLADPDLFDTKEDYIRKSQEILHDMVKDLGVSEYIVNRVEESLADVEEELKKPNLKKVFDLFNKQKGTFIYDHSYLTLMFCNILCKHMDWESKEIRHKLSLACMFHDLGITNPKKAFYEGAPVEQLNTINKELQDEIKNHSITMAKLLEADPDMPQEVINIVLNHHEGKGPDKSYPKGITGVSLTQLECVFIVAHAFVLELYKVAFNTMKIKTAYENVVNDYDSGNFKPILKAFEVAIEEEIKPQMGL